MVAGEHPDVMLSRSLFWALLQCQKDGGALYANEDELCSISHKAKEKESRLCHAQEDEACGLTRPSR